MLLIIIRKWFKINKNKCFFASCMVKFWISLAQDVGETKGIREKKKKKKRYQKNKFLKKGCAGNH